MLSILTNKKPTSCTKKNSLTGKGNEKISSKPKLFKYKKNIDKFINNSFKTNFNWNVKTLGV